MTEQYISAKKVLTTILLNDDTTNILDTYILNYIKINPKLINLYLNDNGLYHVFFRLKDTTMTNNFIRHAQSIILIKSFITNKDATDWILQHGKRIVEQYSVGCITPGVL